MSHSIDVKHALGSYPVYIEPGILGKLSQIVNRQVPGRRAVLVTDNTVHELHGSRRLGSLAWTGETLLVAPGEGSKSRETWARLSDTLLERGFGRDSALIGLGGGVVGDLTGFVAATYMRGIPYVLAPTTLLAMVDASVGGKTGVNTGQGKNLIGAFYPPAAVIADPLALKPLPDKEYREGLAEAVKHGLIADPAYFEWIEANVPSILLREPETVVRLVRRSVEIKAEVVGADERESGRRAILNAGHTVAHAIEAASDYRLSHGESVALGLIAEAEVAERLQIAAPGLRTRVQALLGRLGLVVRMPALLDSAAIVGRMSNDKKNRGGQIHCALLESVGRVHRGVDWTVAVPEAILQKGLETIA